VQLSTGTALNGAGGTISLSVGTIMGDGGDVLLTAGTSLDAASAIVEIRGGLGASAHAVDGGNGGMVRIFGGEARGAKYNAGGSLLLHEYGFRRHRRLGAHRGRCGHRDELGQRAHRDAQRGPRGRVGQHHAALGHTH
jgi:hypothetical protein